VVTSPYQGLFTLSNGYNPYAADVFYDFVNRRKHLYDSSEGGEIKLQTKKSRVAQRTRPRFARFGGIRSGHKDFSCCPINQSSPPLILRFATKSGLVLSPKNIYCTIVQSQYLTTGVNSISF
jgi:hypothetical protein